nr:protein NRT1/ PTR FAMILY 1.2-like [Ipomoea batatas]
MAFVSMTTSSLAADMIKYLMGEYHMDMVSGSNLIYFWYAITYIVPVTGAILADSLMGRFQVIGIASIIGLVGHKTDLPSAKSRVVTAVGSGGVVSCLMAFGADQLKHIQKNAGAMESYFSWYYAIFAFCEVVGLTALVYIQENAGWKIGYGILVVFFLFAALSFFLGSPFYVKQNAKRSLIPGLLKVVVASCRNRNLKFSSGNTQIAYHHNSSTTMDHPSERLSCQGTNNLFDSFTAVTDLLASPPLSWQRSNQQIFRPSPPSLPSTVRDKASVFSADQQIFSTLSSSVPPRTPPLPPPLSRRQVFQPSIVHRHSSSVSLSSPLLAENFPQLA